MMVTKKTLVMVALLQSLSCSTWAMERQLKEYQKSLKSTIGHYQQELDQLSSNIKGYKNKVDSFENDCDQEYESKVNKFHRDTAPDMASFGAQYAAKTVKDTATEHANTIDQAKKNMQRAIEVLNDCKEEIEQYEKDIPHYITQTYNDHKQSIYGEMKKKRLDEVKQKDERESNDLKKDIKKKKLELVWQKKEDLERYAKEEKDRVKHEVETAKNNKDDEIARIRGVEEEKIKNDIYLMEAKAEAKANETINSEKWNRYLKIMRSFGEGIYNFTGDHRRLLSIAGIIVGTAGGVYAAKYGLPVLVNHLVQPRVVSETSRKSLFGWKAPTQTIALSDLIFAPDLQTKLLNIADRVQTAKIYDENLPNVLFYGAPGTGKTAFAKALALCSGLDYALTSGSEFAKITDLNLANNELRKLFDWAKTSDKGLIVFIDEAESLFANRELPTTSKHVQDFINTFLALVPEKSQKNVMFIFATNHPFKLDDAITNRIGIGVEFNLPEQEERTKILKNYLQKFAGENDEALVTVDALVEKNISKYAGDLKGLAPRAIKYVAEEMVIHARREKDRRLSEDVAQRAIKSACESIKHASLWEIERDAWVKAQTAAAA